MIKNITGLIEKITEEVRGFTDVGVVGLSGGVDSLVTACLLRKSLGKENVYTVHLPYGDIDTKTEGRFNENSMKIANKLDVKFIYKSISVTTAAICDDSFDTNDPNLKLKELSQINKGNARSRARMCELYKFAHHLEYVYEKKRARVFGTGNLSEDFPGYDTKYGDSAWDLCLIGELFKSEVYQLAEFFVSEGLIEESMIDRVPSAGLWDGQSDEEELGYSYDEMEPSIRKIATEEWSKENWDEGVDEFVWNRHFANKHKHVAPPVLSIRAQFCDGGNFLSELYRPTGK